MLHDLHAQFAQALVATLLEYARYRVLRLGVEEIVSEVRSLQTGPGLHLHLPPRLAALPDLLVVDQASGDASMLEVKFRRCVDDASAKRLAGSLRQQFEWWPEATAIIITAEPPGAASARYQDYVRLVRPGDLPAFTSDTPLGQRWQALPTLGAVFGRVHDVPGFHQDADNAVAGLRTWTRGSAGALANEALQPTSA